MKYAIALALLLAGCAGPVPSKPGAEVPVPIECSDVLLKGGKC